MYDFNSLLFWYKFIFLTELMFGYLLFLFRLRIRKGIFWRAPVAALCCIAAGFAIPVVQESSVYLSVMVIALFVVTLCGVKLCVDETWSTILFVGMFAYTVQHISYQTYTLFCNILGVGGNIYTGNTDVFAEPLAVLIFISSHVVVYVIAWAVLAYRLKKADNMVIGRNRLIMLSIFILLADVIINAVVVYSVKSTDKVVSNIFAVYNILSCIFALCVQFLMLNSERYENELKIVESLWRKDKHNYEMTKASIELINTKCHDLRHRMRIARNRPQIDENELEEIEKAINIYEGNLKTGNETLDIILSEASFFCHNNDITLICIADGAQLDFMRSGDIYSLIQNGVHNAMNAVVPIKEKDRRIIRIMIRRTGNMVCVHMENYFDAEQRPQFKDGLPVTKQDKLYHGFGMRSIQNVCKKYDGKLSIAVEDDIFNLDIVFAPAETV